MAQPRAAARNRVRIDAELVQHGRPKVGLRHHVDRAHVGMAGIARG